MTRLTLSALLLGVLALPVSAADPTPAELKQQLDDLKKVTDELKKLKDSMTRLDELRSKDIKEIKRRLDNMAAPGSTSLKPDTTAAFKGQGRVRFINQFPEEMSVVVN